MRYFTVLIASVFLSSVSTAQDNTETPEHTQGSVTPKLERIEPVPVPPAPPRVQRTPLPRTGPTRWETMCVLVAPHMNETEEYCDIRHRAQTMADDSFAGVYYWDIRNEMGVDIEVDFEINRTLIFSPDGFLTLNPCHAERHKFVVFDKTLNLSNDWDFYDSNCLSELGPPTYEERKLVENINGYLMETCSLGCDIGWVDDKYYLYNRHNYNLIIMTRLDDINETVDLE